MNCPVCRGKGKFFVIVPFYMSDHRTYQDWVSIWKEYAKGTFWWIRRQGMECWQWNDLIPSDAGKYELRLVTRDNYPRPGINDCLTCNAKSKVELTDEIKEFDLKQLAWWENQCRLNGVQTDN